ncbi:MAG: hypothetical protein IJ944_02925 [Clostridia bacterium]|nr:hypothetical protein [Clostridia bacterium]
MIYETKFKDRPAVALETHKLIALFLPNDGGKMVSLKRKENNKELLAVKEGDTYKVLTETGSYVESECSGFDDMFPTVDPYTPQNGKYKGVTYPCHGEVCRIPHQYTILENQVNFYAESKLFDVTYYKSVAITKSGGFAIRYVIKNSGDEDFPFLWAGHIMLKGEDGMRVFTPFPKDTKTEFMFASSGYDKETLPKDRLMGYIPEKGATYKFYYLDKIPEGWFGISYPDNSKLFFNYNEEVLPYLGIWLNNGEFQNIYTITPEPCNLPFDAPDRAEKRGLNAKIKAKDSFEFVINIELEK